MDLRLGSVRVKRPLFYSHGSVSRTDLPERRPRSLKAAIERIGKAIDEEAAKGQGEDWSLMVGYVQSCREKLPGAIEEWQKE